MTTAEARYNHPHPLQRGSVLLLAAGLVVGAAQMTTGGIEAVKAKWQSMEDTSLGMKNIEIISSDKPNMTNVVGTATAGCIDGTQFGVNRVRKVRNNPESFLVSVRQIGEGALDAASVDACITKQTGANVEVIVRQK